MLQTISIILLTLFCFFLQLLLRSYRVMSAGELKRQARHGNKQAKRAYSVIGVYGLEAWLVIWLFIAASAAVIILLLDRLMWNWVAILVAVPVIIFLFGVTPHLTKPHSRLKLAAKSSRVLEPILRFIHPVLSRLLSLVGSFVNIEHLQAINSKEELIEMLQRTEVSDSISENELRIAEKALTFGDVTIGSIMIPLGIVKVVKAEEVLSPVVLGELHDTGFSRFPVIQDKQFVGTLYLKDAVENRSNKTIASVMRKEVYYVNELASLDQAFSAFLRTKHHLFLVVNEFEEVSGIVTIEDVLERIIGTQIIDEFDEFDDLRQVAMHRAKEIKESRAETVVE